MIPNLINKIKVTLNIAGSTTEQKQQKNKQKQPQPQPQQPKSTQKDNDKLQQQQSPPSPTFKTVQKQLQNVSITQTNTSTTKPGIETVGKHGQSQFEFMKQAQKKKQSNQFRPISLKQLSQHKAKQSAWLSLDGIVYDVTVYLKHHPGGVILLQGCGKECRQLFDQYHSWVNAKNLLGKYKIGWLVQ